MFVGVLVKSKDKIAERILIVINNSDEPLETKDIEMKIPEETRTKILYRLMNLRGEGLINGKKIGAGKGTWIWWRMTDSE